MMKRPGTFLRTTLALAFIFLSVAQISYADFGPMRTKREREPRSADPSPAFEKTATYEKIQGNFLKENYAAVEDLSDRYLRSSQTDPSVYDEVLYLKAFSLLKLDRGEEARVIWRSFEDKNSNAHERVFARSAAISIADSYYFEGRKDLAHQSYEAALSKFPDSEETDYARQRLVELRSFAPAGFLPLRQMAMEEIPVYSVQVGSFSKQANAEELVKRLSRSEFDVRVDSNSSDPLYRVRVGKFTSRQEAEALQTRLKREGYPTKIVP